MWDDTKPDGTPRKLLDVTRLRSLGWSPSIELRHGIETTYQWYVEQLADHTALRGVDQAMVG